MSKEKMIEKVRKLFKLAGNNPSMEEAQAALLKAQQIMAEYEIDEADVNLQKELKYVLLKATHANNEGFRVPLSSIIARNFRCKNIMVGAVVHFYGREEDVQVCVEVFNYAYKFAKNRGIALRNKYREEGKYHKGVANSYFRGFMAGLQAQLDSQSTALAIIVPPDVNENFSKTFTKLGKYNHGMAQQHVDFDVYGKGKQDGQAFFSRTQISGK